MSKLIVSKVGEQMQKGKEENRAEIISELEREKINIMKDLNNIKEDIDKKIRGEQKNDGFPD